MSDLFDSLKKTKKTSSITTSRKTHRELSPVKFPFSEDEDSDVERPAPVKKNGKVTTQTQKLLAKMRKCEVRLPKDKDGRLLQRIHAEWKKARKNKKMKSPIVKLKNLTAIPKSPKTPKEKKSPESNKKATPAKVYVKFPLSSPNSNKKKKTYAKTPLKKVQKPKPRGHDIASKRLNATPALVREFGKRFFMSFVDIQDCNLVKMMKNPRLNSSRKLNSSVRFNDTVEYFGTSESESDDEQFTDPTPVSLVTALNGSYEKPAPKKRGRKRKEETIEVKRPILTPAAKKNYRLADEKRINVSMEEEEDDDAEYIVPTEISPPKKQATPPPRSSRKSPSPETTENTSLNHPEEILSDPEPEPVAESVEPEQPPQAESSPVRESTPVAEENKEPEQEQNDIQQIAELSITEENEDAQNNSHHNDFDNDEDSQGQNIVQDFISRTVQDLSHDDSEDIQDDEDLVEEKGYSTPPAFKTNVSNNFSEVCDALNDKIIENPTEAMETDNNA